MVMRKTRLSGVVAVLGVALLLASCSQTGEDGTAAAEFGPDRPGRYSVGDRFTFDNPNLTWSVVSVESDRVFWRSDRGDEQVTGHDPLFPSLEWKNPGQGGGRRAISDIKGTLFPLKTGNRLTFSTNTDVWGEPGTGREPRSWQYGWSCKVAGRERVDVPAGSFDTFKVFCGRVKQDENIFYYAPKIGHFVVMRMDDPGGEGTITRNLLSFRRVALGGPEVALPEPPPAAPAPPPEPVQPQPIAPPPPPPPTKELPPPPVAVKSGSGPRAVLGLFSSNENAKRAWNLYQTRHGGLIEGLNPQITTVTSRSQGTLFRLATNRLENRATVQDLCRKLKAQGSECIVSNK